MTIDARLESLGQRHRQLDALITEETQRPYRDETLLQQLKRRKLAIKDEMSTLAIQAVPDDEEPLRH